MIGAILAKRKIRTAFAKLNQGDIDSFLADWADDAVFEYPAAVSVGGTIKGKKAIAEWFRKFMDQVPKREFVSRNVCVRDIFSLTATNVLAVEWDVTVTNKQGLNLKGSGVTVTDVRNFKAVRVTDYIPDIAALKRLWNEA